MIIAQGSEMSGSIVTVVLESCEVGIIWLEVVVLVVFIFTFIPLEEEALVLIFIYA